MPFDRSRVCFCAVMMMMMMDRMERCASFSLCATGFSCWRTDTRGMQRTHMYRNIPCRRWWCGGASHRRRRYMIEYTFPLRLWLIQPLVCSRRNIFRNDWLCGSVWYAREPMMHDLFSDSIHTNQWQNRSPNGMFMAAAAHTHTYLARNKLYYYCNLYARVIANCQWYLRTSLMY